MVRYPLCSLPSSCTLAKEVQLFPGLIGLYAGIFVMYFQCRRQSNKSTDGTPTIVSYAVCLLYVVSTVTFVSDIVNPILEASKSIFKNIMIIFLSVVQARSNFSFRVQRPGFEVIASGCCDFNSPNSRFVMSRYYK